MIEIFVKPDAEIDLLEAFEYYEEQVTGLGSEFVRCIDAKIEFIRRNPLSYPKKHNDFRRALVHRFPYGIYYKIEDERIVIFAVLHLKQEPKKIILRLKKEV
ncbi:MAG TPA: type II toxin-antitoxin system RelE/ParE family toxin [Thermodesulfovibrionia bacterium]|nr:type II toxin-antitoxin system RelE/ParE family toxin [Thermodesulfovibrionia bacterium]